MASNVQFENEKRRVFYGQTNYGESEIEAVLAILKNQPLMLMDGPSVKDFECQVADLFGKKYGLMVNSGSSANLLAVAMLGLPHGSEIITPALNWATTIAPMLQYGLKPVFVDVDSDTFVINVEQIEPMIGPKTRAMMVPDLIGNIPQWDRLAEIAQRHDLITIHDSADTIGGTFQSKPTGAFSDITTTSFYASHVLTCAGFGGMLCCNDSQHLQQAKLLRGWGRRSSLTNEAEAIEHRFNCQLDGLPYDNKFIFDGLGYNFLPSEMGAAFGLVQLGRLPSFIESRIRNFKTLFTFFENYQDWFTLPREHETTRTPWLAFPLIIKTDAPFKRIDLQVFFEEQGIQTRPIFTGNILRHPGFKEINCRVTDDGYPNADCVMEGGVMFGCHQSLTEMDLDYICQKFRQFADKITV